MGFFKPAEDDAIVEADEIDEVDEDGDLGDGPSDDGGPDTDLAPG